MPSDTLSPRELTRRLVSRSVPPSETPDGAALAVHAACERTYRELTRRLGATGSDALVTRALAQAQADHPLLKEIRISGQSKPGLDGVTGAVQAHGAPAVAAGLEAALEKLLGLLGRLIGDDMVVRLVEASAPIETPDDQDGK